MASGTPERGTTAARRAAATNGGQYRSRMNRYANQRRQRMRIAWSVIGALAVISLAYFLVSRTTSNQSVACATSATSGTTGTPAANGGPPIVTGKVVTVGNTCLKYIDLKVGTGPAVKNGDTITVNYSGWLANGTEFDSSVDPQFQHVQTLPVTLGQGQVIVGWEKGLIGMKAGGSRRLIIPPDLGYGVSGSPPTIPANAVLVFDVSVVKIG
ncbi:MAG TPA: FKBP-type peptidyl-prolyl cis-trans isomerase [Ktedonobacterales bacterium]|nr:FKBP-type peptidyl-prolyl cis-trans isomerase [Ktedonobacterales bacterium]